MIRPVTLLTIAMACGSGFYMFAIKHQAQTLDQQLDQATHQTRLAEERIRVLKAEWSLENDPTRLSRLAGQFTNLRPMQPDQLTSLQHLAEILPQPGSPLPDQGPVLPLPPPAPPGPPGAVGGGFVASAHAPAPQAAKRPVLARATMVARPRVAQLSPHMPQREPPRLAQPLGASLMSVSATAARPNLTRPAPVISRQSLSALGGGEANLPPPMPIMARGEAP